MNVVLIKSESDGPDKFMDELQKSNFNVTMIPSIDFKFKNLDKLNDIISYHADYDGIIFTSPRAVQAMKTAVEHKHLQDWILKEFNYCVGEGTYKQAEKQLNIKTKGKEAGNALKLSSIIADDFVNRTEVKKLLFPCGNLKQDILEKNLREKSIELDVIEVYETIQHPNLDKSIENLHNINFLVFFSPSSVKFSLPILLNHRTDMNTVKKIAIGPSTEKCLASFEIKCDGVCDKPLPENLLNILNNFL